MALAMTSLEQSLKKETQPKRVATEIWSATGWSRAGRLLEGNGTILDWHDVTLHA